MKPIFGKKTVLFSFEQNQKDIEFLFKILTPANKQRFLNLFAFKDENDELGYVIDYIINSNDIHTTYLVKTMQGKASKNIGVIYIINYYEHLRQIVFIPDEQYLNGLSKYLDSNELSYLEDCLTSLINEYSDVKRLEIKLLSEDKIMQKLIKKIGFKREGVLKSYYKNCTSFKDVSLYSMVKD